MGFKTCSQVEFEKAMNNFDKVNRNNKTSHREPTLAEQLELLEQHERRLKEKRRLEQLSQNTRMTPLAQAQYNVELKEKQQTKKTERKKK
jgi:hypothetical protein